VANGILTHIQHLSLEIVKSQISGHKLIAENACGDMIYTITTPTN
jgi:hypothetical protein